MRSAAFFDVDGTLVRHNTGGLWARWMRRRGEMSLADAARMWSWLFRYRLALLDVEAVTARVNAKLRGQSEAVFAAKCREFFADAVEVHIAEAGRRAVAAHRAAGELPVLLTSSSRYLVEPLAERLGIEHILCTLAEIRDGKFFGTHQPPACFGAGKVHWAERFAAAEGIDLGRSFFYSDSYTDLPMLERVGAARVINPDPRLRRHAERVGWPIADW